MKTFLFWISCVAVPAFGQTSPSTTLRFEVAENDFDESKDYSLGELLESRRVPTYRSFKTVYEIKPLTRSAQVVFRPGKTIFGQDENLHEYFDENIVQEQRSISEEVRSLIAADSKVRSVAYAYVEQKPLTIRLQVDGDKILFQATGLVIRAKADIRVSGTWERLLCGSTARTTISANLHAFGEYDLESGHVRITRIDPNESVDVDCSSVLGQIFDFALDWWVDKEVNERVANLVDPILARSVQAGSLREKMDEEAARVEGQIGINFAEAAWGGILSYTNGVTLEIDVGVDYFGTDQHLLGFRLFNAGAPTVTTHRYSRGWNEYSYDKITCPSWSKSMTVYEAIPVKTGTRWAGRGRRDLYGARRFKKIPVSGLSYSRVAGCTGRFCRGGRADNGIAVSCTGKSGASSFHVESGIPCPVETASGRTLTKSQTEFDVCYVPRL